MAANIPGVPFQLTAENSGSNDILGALQRGLQMGRGIQEFPVDLRTKQLANILQQAKADVAPQREQADLRKILLENKYYGPEKESEIGYRGAETRKLNTMTPLEALKTQLANEQAKQMNPLEIEEQRIKNQFAPQREQADIDYKKMGGGRGSTGSKDEAIFAQSVERYNPQLKTPEEKLEAIDAYGQGRDTLSNGTKLAPMTEGSELKRNFDRAYKSTTTSGLITAGIKANQAEAEMPALDKAISEGRSYYGDTVLGVSPKLQKDSLDVNNDAAQERLGKYYAADLLNFDKAALQTRISGTESGVTILNEIMDKARQSVNSATLLKTDKSRQAALDQVSDTLKKMLSARNKYGIGASGASGKRSSPDSNNDPLGIR